MSGQYQNILAACEVNDKQEQKKIETIYVISGILELHLKDQIITLFEGQSFHIEPYTIHRFACPKDAWGVELVEVSTPELDDVVRLQDDYGRV